MHINQNIKRICLSDITIYDYQRDLNNSRTQRIADNFDANKVGVLTLSRRSDGTYAVMDGQHRLCAMRKLGITEVNCVVINDLTYEQEAKFFREQAKNTQIPNALADYRAGLAEANIHYLNIQSILDKNGYKVGSKTEPKIVTAVNTLSRIMSVFGSDALDLSLQYITTAWHGDPTALRREMLVGMAEFALRYGNVVTPDLFNRRLGNWLPSDIFYEYRRRSDGHINKQSAFKPMFRRLFCIILCERYNKGLGNNSKIRLIPED
ncbi:MAG: DUF6551 family protein [Eubacteriales bacterium]